MRWLWRLFVRRGVTLVRPIERPTFLARGVGLVISSWHFIVTDSRFLLVFEVNMGNKAACNSAFQCACPTRNMFYQKIHRMESEGSDSGICLLSFRFSFHPPEERRRASK